MANYVTIKFQHISDMTMFKRVAVNSDGYIDFNILLPMPETMHIDSPQYGELPEGFVFPDAKRFNLGGFLQRCVDRGVPVSLALADYNRQLFGFADWYDWSVNYWGTKWNAHGEPIDKVPGELPVFRTAWCIPEGWLRALAKHVDFTLLYADEDMGSNCGRIKASHGEMTIEKLEYGAESIALAYYVRYYGNEGKQALIEDHADGSSKEYQDAIQNYDEYICKWVC